MLTKLTHEFSTGSVTALTGPSGRGKSTLLYLLGLLLAPSDGDVVVQGQPTRRLGDATRARMRARTIGFVFQDASLDPSRPILDSVVEPLLYDGGSRAAARTRALQLLDQVGVKHRAGHRPGRISGGQAQRVAICRALVNDPPIILADEPTGNLDRENSAAILAMLVREARERERTVIIATHDPFVLEHAHHVLHLP